MHNYMLKLSKYLCLIFDPGKPGIGKYILACEHTFYVLCRARRWLEADSYLLPIPG